MERVKDKVALITGGANGIGKATAKKLASEGAKVAITDIDVENGEKIAKELQNEGEVKFYEMDVTNEEHWQKIPGKVEEDLGKINVLHNNAGIYIIKSVKDTTSEEFDKLMNINVKGVFLGMKYCAPLIEKNGGGSIINMSSVAGLVGVAGHTIYGGSKGAVRIMNKDVATEYAKKNVRVNSVHPGYIDTGMADYGAQTMNLSKEDLDKMHPMGHMGQPEDVANAVLFLASDESRFITASELVIDGGTSNCLTV